MQQTPFLKLLAVLIIGISAAYIYHFHFTQAQVYFLLLFLFSLIFCWIFLCNKILKNVCVFLFTALLGAVITSLNCGIHKVNHFSNLNYTTYIGKIDSEPHHQKNLIRFDASILAVLNETWVVSSGKVAFTLQVDSNETPHLLYGDLFVSNSKLTEISAPLNPGEFNIQSWQRGKNIFHSTFAQAKDFKKSAINQGNILIKAALSIRKNQVNRFKEILRDTTAYNIASTLILGYRSELTQEVIQSFSATGTIHALSVSGAHVAILYALLIRLLFFFRNNKIENICKVLIIIKLLWGYALLTGFSPSVLRSVIMISIYIIATQFKQNQSSLNILSFSAVALLLYKPSFIVDVGFQLSYLAVTGLLLLQPIIQNFLSPKWNWLAHIWSYISMSLAAQIATLPLSIYYFQQFPVYFLFGNLFILLPLNCIMALGALALIPQLNFIAPLLEYTLQFTYGGLHWLSKLPYSTIQGIQYGKIEVLLTSFAITALSVGFLYRKFWSICSGLFAVLITQSLLLYQQLKSKDQILIYSMKSNWAISFQSNRHSGVFSNLSEIQSAARFSILPSIKNYSPEAYSWKILSNKHVHLTFEFKQKRVLVTDTCYKQAIPKGYDLVLVTGKNNNSYEQNHLLLKQNKMVVFTHQPGSLDRAHSLAFNPKNAYILMNKPHFSLAFNTD